jgi:molybdenum cofactor cytidylyltransferase
MIRCSGILLAAGFSSRMGSVKALLPWEGKTLLEHQLTQMSQSKMTQSIIVLGWQANTLLSYIEKRSCDVVVNPHFEKGKTESVKSGLRAVKKEADCLILMNIDQPVTYQILNQMIDHFYQTKKNIVIPVYKERRGHPILFSTSLIEELSHVKEETQGLKEIIHRRSEDISELNINDPSILLNFNTIDDFENRGNRTK